MICIPWWGLSLFYRKVCQGFLSFEEGNSESWPFLCDRACSLQYTSKCPCSYLSNNIVFLWGSIYGYSLDVLACCGLPLVLYISKTWGWWEQGISIWNLLHAYIIIPWHEWRDLFHAVVFCHLLNLLICICRMDQFSASEAEHPICLLWGF